jgi:hypothetical protein
MHSLPFLLVKAFSRNTRESKIEKTHLPGRPIRAPGGSPAGLDRTRKGSSPDGGKRNLRPASIPACECGGEAFSPGRSSPAGPLSFVGLPPGGLNSPLLQNAKGDPCLSYFGIICNLRPAQTRLLGPLMNLPVPPSEPYITPPRTSISDVWPSNPRAFAFPGPVFPAATSQVRGSIGQSL